MKFRPGPRRPDYFAEVLKLRPPVQFVFDLVARSDQRRRITDSPRADSNRDIYSGHFCGRFNDLSNGITFAAATQVVHSASLLEHSQRENVRARQIYNVNVISHTRAITSRIVVSVDFYLPNSSQRPLQHQRYQMCFWMMAFTQATARACRVEVPQRDISQSICELKPAKSFLECELRFTVRICRTSRVIFFYGLFLRFAEDRGGRGKNQPIDRAFAHGFQQREPCRN